MLNVYSNLALGAMGFAVCIAALIIIAKNTNKHIENDKDVEKDTNLVLRGFWATFLGGWLIGALVIRSHNQLIREKWNEVDKLTGKTNLGGFLGAAASFAISLVMFFLGTLPTAQPYTINDAVSEIKQETDVPQKVDDITTLTNISTA